MSEPIFDQAKQLLSQDKKLEAGRLLAAFLQHHPTDAEAWFLFSGCVEVPEQKLDCLQRALRYCPDFAEAQSALEQLTGAVVNANMVEIEDKPTEVPTKQVKATLHGPTKKTTVKPVEMIDRTGERIRSRQPGESVKNIAEYYNGQRKIDHIFLYIFGFAFLGTIVLTFIYRHSLILSILYMFLIAYLFYKIVDVVRYFIDDSYNKNSYTKGAIGEIQVGQILSTLGPAFCVWNDVTVNHGNIDHVVLSKNGHLFMIETKANSGRVTIENSTLRINGKLTTKNLIRQCLNNLFDLQEAVQESTGIKVWISAILVFTNAFVESGKPIKGIRIVNQKYLSRTIHEQDRERGGNTTLWQKADDLDTLFNAVENPAPELHKANFKPISSLGKIDFSSSEGDNRRKPSRAKQTEASGESASGEKS
jgi:Nuclease-related domain